MPKPALALARAGYRSLADLEGTSWADLRKIGGLGPQSLDVIEELLGHPLPHEGTSRPPLPREPWPEDLWRRRGLHVEAAITFAQEGMTIERLKTMSREELLGWTGVGEGTIRACELIIGQVITSRAGDPVEAFWRRQGLHARTARALSRAGIGTLEDLRKQTREDLLALRGVGEIALGQMEAFLGETIPSRAAYWLDRGLDVGMATAFLREGIRTLEDLGGLTREQFLSFRGLGYWALHQCERLLGRKLPRGAG